MAFTFICKAEAVAEGGEIHVDVGVVKPAKPQA
jgi:hypothetical protein